jgi:hypothetical protein
VVADSAFKGVQEEIKIHVRHVAVRPIPIPVRADDFLVFANLDAVRKNDNRAFLTPTDPWVEVHDSARSSSPVQSGFRIVDAQVVAFRQMDLHVDVTHRISIGIANDDCQIINGALVSRADEGITDHVP